MSNTTKEKIKTGLSKSLDFIRKKAKNVFYLLWSKGVVFAVPILLMLQYIKIRSDEPIPFIELLYGLIVLFLIFAVAAVNRLLFFAEASEIAESGRLRELLKQGKFTPEIAHYWFVTGINLIISALCLTGLFSI